MEIIWKTRSMLMIQDAMIGKMMAEPGEAFAFSVSVLYTYI